MSNLIKKILNGIINTTSTKSEEKEVKMINIKMNIPELDLENQSLLQASQILESLGNEPNPTAGEFYAQLLDSSHPVEDHEAITMAAISIETMMNSELTGYAWEAPTIH
jgi:hypothetical protein